MASIMSHHISGLLATTIRWEGRIYCLKAQVNGKLLKNNPFFEGHYQPRQPLWGYSMDNDPKMVEKWIDVATEHDVNEFAYDWYWYEEGPFLESVLND